MITVKNQPFFKYDENFSPPDLFVEQFNNLISVYCRGDYGWVSLVSNG